MEPSEVTRTVISAKHKIDIDHETAVLVGRSHKEVRKITAVFLKVLMQHIVEKKKIALPGFGQFTLKTSKRGNNIVGPNGVVIVEQQHRVWFMKSQMFSAVLRRELGAGGKMEKYGVDESVDAEDLEKKAAQGCPGCGRKDLVKHGSLLFCPVHGSEPFENSPRRGPSQK